MVPHTETSQSTFVELASALALDDLNSINAFFHDNEVDEPIIQWGSEIGDLELSAMEHLKSYWHDISSRYGLPPSRYILPEALRPALGRILVLEPMADLSDFRYRLYGTVLASRMRRDFTGTLVSQFEDSYISGFYLATYRAVCERQEMLYTCHFPSARSYATKFQRLILPFGENGTVNRIVCFIESEPRDQAINLQLQRI